MLHKENYSFNTLTIRELELLVLGQQQAIRLYSALGKGARAAPLQELPLVALHGGTQYHFQAPRTAAILAAGSKKQEGL